MKRLKHKGFAHLELLAFLIIIVVIGGVGRVVYNHSKHKSNSSGSVKQAATSVPTYEGVQLGLGYTGVPFGSNFWGQPLPASTPVNPNSSTYDNEIVQALASSVPASKECYLSTTNAPPIYVVPANQPKVAVTRQYGYDQFLYDEVFKGGIPIPPFAAASDSSDHTMIIYQPSTQTLWEMWRVQKDNQGNWQVGNAGKIVNVPSSNGIFAPAHQKHPPANDGLPGGGTSATGDALIGVVNRIEELQAGSIGHPVDLELPHTIVLNTHTLPANTPGATKPYSWPSNRNPDGTSSNPLAIPEGLRFRIDPSLNLNSLNLSPVAHTLAVAAQKYGFIVENTGPDCNIKLGNPQPYLAAGLPDPYKALFGSDYGSLYSPKVMANFPWDHLQALPYNYGQTNGS